MLNSKGPFPKIFFLVYTSGTFLCSSELEISTQLLYPTWLQLISFHLGFFFGLSLWKLILFSGMSGPQCSCLVVTSDARPYVTYRKLCLKEGNLWFCCSSPGVRRPEPAGFKDLLCLYQQVPETTSGQASCLPQASPTCSRETEVRPSRFRSSE